MVKAKIPHSEKSGIVAKMQHGETWVCGAEPGFRCAAND
ncbi:hypothetical protein LDG_5729 [Legionella drancourtii LLAP12]|uniref:Uncharacterized protein n=1 Tax=Legionella drancourtii LLAP12 TaxID=658187 RepID=G9EKJ4_9GAMM|nr:hypothetical protein LDG_5729 [Legionella drancourtii LLAP12]